MELIIQKFAAPLIKAFARASLVAVLIACGANARADQSAPPANSAAPAPATAPTPAPPLSSPAMVGPLTMASPNEINLPAMVPSLSELPEPIAKLFDFDVNGVVSALGIVQNHPVPGDYDLRGDFSNAQAIIQKADGVIQYYLQVGGYSIPALGAPYIPLHQAVNALYGPLPVAYLKIAPTSNFSIMAGNLPTLIGAEYTFTFENMNIERGLLWNQENAINRGVQLNYSLGPLSASLAWSNGFYSHSYTWLSGSLAYAINPANTLTFVGAGNLGFAASNNLATPLLLNNGQIYNLIYEYNAAPLIIEPYFQWTVVPHNPKLGVFKTTSTIGGAILASYAFTDNIFLAGRAEYIGTNGTASDGAANLLYGPGSEAWSITLTPTYQYKKFFARLEGAYVQAMGYTSGGVFGKVGDHPSQVGGALEMGFIL
ncbi:MAG TPA: outer membrane beta-barrel protein [Candidatus Binataceae bacterium]|nr:outer membrane beta-barrel protein [Candidatus Binataceae bacterium]